MLTFLNFIVKKLFIQIFILICLIQLSTQISYSQKFDFVYKDTKDSTKNYYAVLKPGVEIKGLLILLSGFGETPEYVIKETLIPQEACKAGIMTVIPRLQDGWESFYVDTKSQLHLDSLITSLFQKYNLANNKLYVGGFSSGGSGAIKYAERARVTNSLIKPNAVFCIDSPLDFERLLYAFENMNRISLEKKSNEESNYFISRIKKECGGTPKENIKGYFELSPYSYSDTTFTSVKKLIHQPVLLITEPEIDWRLETKNENIYLTHLNDITGFKSTLTYLGNKNIQVWFTNNKGYRITQKKKNPHSWSIANAKKVVEWLVSF